MSASTASMQPGTTRSGHTSAIRAKKVIGTTVRNAAGEKIGTIEDIVLDKLSNNIMFTVCGFGGFLGMGEKYHPIPWGLLNYDDAQDAYAVNVTTEQLRAAPADTIEELMKGNASEYRDRAYSYYKAPKYW
jgi:sporulation protein YlmC with PRC-barrel domain